VEGGFGGAAGLGAGAGAPDLLAGAAVLATVAPATLAAGAAAAVRMGGALGGAGGAPPGKLTLGAAGAEAVGAPGREGSLIVGDAVGLGGSEMRTVSLRGCTFASAGLGGSASPGVLGVFSDIRQLTQAKFTPPTCQTLIS
jgi:hypothetical protein